MSTPRLLTLPPSHYSEKARWALDRLGVAHQEEASGAGFHYRALKKVGARTMPVLLIDGQVLKDSTEILQFLDGRAEEGRRLFPAEPSQRAEVEKLEDDLDERLGPLVRSWMYSWVLDMPLLLLGVFSRRTPVGQRLATAGMVPVLGRVMRKKMALNRLDEPWHFEKLRGFLAEYDARLADGRKFLVGDRFSAADLTLAALAAPALAPEKFGGAAVPLKRRPKEFRLKTEQLRATPAGQHVMRMYEERR